jgi:hypothetical protein
MPQPRKLWLPYIATFAVTAVALFSGCRPAPLAYHLGQDHSNLVLLPPQIVIANPSFDLTIKNARQIPVSTSKCDIESDLITLHWVGKTAHVKLKEESYAVEPESASAATQDSQRMFLDPLQSIKKFRFDLANLETNGCLRPGESQRLNIALSEELPLSTEAGYRLRFGAFDLTGVFDLASDFRLDVSGPVYATGANDSAKQVTGFEHAYYNFTPSHKGNRTQISLASATETDLGKAPFAISAPQNTLALPESPGYFRIVFRSSSVLGSTAISIATLLSAPEASTLEEATTQLMSGPAYSCDTVTAHGANCMIFPPRVGVSIELGVHVNGRQVFVGLGGWLDDTVKGAGSLAVIEKTLQVRRLYRGHLIPIKFDPTSEAIFALVLMPGDEITW